MTVAYHVSELTNVTFALGNIRNRIKDIDRADTLNMVLVAHGHPEKAFIGLNQKLS